LNGLPATYVSPCRDEIPASKIPTQDIVLPPPTEAPIGATTMLFGDMSFGGHSFQAASAASSFRTEHDLRNLMNAEEEAECADAYDPVRADAKALTPTQTTDFLTPPPVAAPTSTLLQRRKSTGGAVPRLNLNLSLEAVPPANRLATIDGSPPAEGGTSSLSLNASRASVA
jgi:hypothetical protein